MERTEHSKKLVIGISSRALFDLDREDQIFREEGVAAYEKYQIEHEDEPLDRGVYLPLVQKLLALNGPDKESEDSLVEVILLSRNNANISLRIFNSIKHHELDIQRAAFCTGNDPYRYARDFNCSLFLSAEADDARGAIKRGVAAGRLMVPQCRANAPDHADRSSDDIRFAFDGDAVIFSDEAERVFQLRGKSAFIESEQKAAREPLAKGPFHDFLVALQSLQQQLRQRRQHLQGQDQLPSVRTAIITARDLRTHERFIRTLRGHGISVDEALFLGGTDKSEFLLSYGADIFFDDQEANCTSAASKNIATAQVPGVAG